MTALATQPSLTSAETWIAELTRLAEMASEAATLALQTLRRASIDRDTAPDDTRDKADRRLERSLRDFGRLSGLAQRTLTLLARARGWLTAHRAQPAAKPEPAPRREPEPTPEPTQEQLDVFKKYRMTRRQRREFAARLRQKA